MSTRLFKYPPVLAAVIACAACSPPSNTDAGMSCVPGQTVACVCDGGAHGAQTCSASGTYGACACGSIDASDHCQTDVDCSDHVFCNGEERCSPGAAGADARGCAPALTVACSPSQTCDEAATRCTALCPDEDTDGHPRMDCGGDDCDDHDPHRFPGNAEVCAFDEATGLRVDPTHDEDCNPASFASMTGDGDRDGDGYVDRTCCNRTLSGGMQCGDDCADVAAMPAAAPFAGEIPAASIHPTQAEVCNGADDNCNGTVDEGHPANSYSPDCDGDGYGDAHATAMIACDPSAFPPCNGHPPVPNSGDCDDTPPAGSAVHPGAVEVCDAAARDEDCDGSANVGCSCTGAMTRPCCGSPARGTQACSSGAWGPCSVSPIPEVCNGIDDDCDGAVDDGLPPVACYTGAAGTQGVGPCHGGTQTCTGGAPGTCAGEVRPATETCNDVDDNCDGMVDNVAGAECRIGGAQTLTTCGVSCARNCSASSCTWASSCTLATYRYAWSARAGTVVLGGETPCGPGFADNVCSSGTAWSSFHLTAPSSPIQLPPGDYQALIGATVGETPCTLDVGVVKTTGGVAFASGTVTFNPGFIGSIGVNFNTRQSDQDACSYGVTIDIRAHSPGSCQFFRMIDVRIDRADANMPVPFPTR